MPSYTKHNIGLSLGDVQRLAKGHGVHIKQSHVGSGVAVYLTHGQHKKVMNGGGVVTMSKHQIHHNIRHGGGFWDTIKSAAKNLFHTHKHKVKDFAISQAKKHLPGLAHKALDKVGAHKYAQNSIARYGIDKAREAVDRFAGSGASVGNLGASNVSRPIGRKSRSTKRGGSFLLP